MPSFLVQQPYVWVEGSTTTRRPQGRYQEKATLYRGKALTGISDDCSAFQCADVFSKFKTCIGAKITTGSSDSHTQYKTGFDCGTAKYTMHDPKDFTPQPPFPNKPKTPLTVHNGVCYGADRFDSHGDIHAERVSQFSGYVCGGLAVKKIQAGKPKTFLEFHINNGAPYWFRFYWQDGCELENGSTEMDSPNPLTEKDVGYGKCSENL
ncbi:hypothetical protein PG994_012944 [Apiospora phragmitis]|uniref:Uncharacterized protein n=1 Tax=Apiospora phragmitis TaxID=2905665 RepID=A0ABR1T787_9PEZI